MKTSTHSNSESPVSSSEAPAKPRQKTVPIARNHGSGYERPERARTSHACEPCRERKTKCDGERPSCRRCLHTGTGCHYGYGKGWKKRKTAEDLTVTSKRLARYESLLNEIMPLVDPKVQAMIESVRLQEAALSQPMNTIDSNAVLSDHLMDAEYQSTSPSINRLPLPMSTAGPGSSSFSPTSRNLPIPSHSGEAGSQGLHNHVSHSSIRMSPTDDSGGIRLPSITRHGVLLEADRHDLGIPRQTASAPDDLSTTASQSPSTLVLSISDGISQQRVTKSQSHG